MALGSTQGYFLGYRRPLRKADNLQPSCAVVTKSGSLNFPEPSGLVQACNGTALSFMYNCLAKMYSVYLVQVMLFPMINLY